MGTFGLRAVACPWLLEPEANYEYIKRKLTHLLEAQYAANLITSGAYEQALGQAAAAFD